MICPSPIKFIFKIILCLYITIGPCKLYARQNVSGKKYYVGVEMGTALLQLSQNNNEGDRTARYVLGFYGGFIPFRALRIGINLNGYLIESFGNFYTNPEKGISISNTMAQLQVFPFKRIHLFANVEGGWSTYVNHHPDEYNAKGIAGKAGIGYEFYVAKRLFATLKLNYSNGNFNDTKYTGILITNQHYQSSEIVLGITYK